MPEAIRVFVIDDEPDFCFFLKHNLEACGGCSVTYENDPVTGLKEVRRSRPDVVVLDVSMPRLDGLQVLGKLKNDLRTQGLPVIMVTALEDDKTRLEANRHYVECFVPKPVDAQELHRKIGLAVKRSARG